MKKFEKLLYVENTLSQQGILFFVLGNTVFTILHINTMNIDIRLGVFVLLNIFLSLLAFLMAVRQKIYASAWGYAGIALAVFQLARWLWIPEEIVGNLRLFLVALLIATSIVALAASMLCIQRSQERQKFIIENNVNLSTLQK